MRLSRNAPCHCGSGRKYKKCCLDKDQARELTDYEAKVIRSRYGELFPDGSSRYEQTIDRVRAYEKWRKGV